MSRHFIILLILIVSFFSIEANQEVDRHQEHQIIAMIEDWNLGWEKKDAALAAKWYSDDADWTNAFGFYKKGRAEIEKFLGEVFALPFVMAGRGKVLEQSIRFIQPNVALVRTKVERTGQLTPSGETLGPRETSHLRVFLKLGNNWKIISHLISDARSRENPKH
jgi:uncharacterized protein (TIGR02246 family)